jgi:hypothetical protein
MGEYNYLSQHQGRLDLAWLAFLGEGLKQF